MLQMPLDLTLVAAVPSISMFTACNFDLRGFQLDAGDCLKRNRLLRVIERQLDCSRQVRHFNLEWIDSDLLLSA